MIWSPPKNSPGGPDGEVYSWEDSMANAVKHLIQQGSLGSCRSSARRVSPSTGSSPAPAQM
jgi:hypothetical protein